MPRTLYPHHSATAARVVEQRKYADRQRAHRAAMLAEPIDTAGIAPATAAALTDAEHDVNADDLADAVRLTMSRRYTRRAVDAQEVRAAALYLLPALLLAGHEPADAAALAIYRADRRALSALIQSKERAAGIGTDADADAPDVLALALAAVNDDAGAEWLPVASTPRPDALRIVAPLSPEDAHEIALDSLSPHGRRILAATLDANEGADVRAMHHRDRCSKPAAKPSGCCRRDAITPALRTSVVAQAVTGSTSGPARTATKRDQVAAGADYLQAGADARRARTEADAASWNDAAEAARDRRTLAGERMANRAPQEPATGPASPVWHDGARYLPWAALAATWSRQDVESVANGDSPRSIGTTRSDVEALGYVWPTTDAESARFVAPDPDTMGSAARLAGSAGYDVAEVIDQEANAASRKERHEAGLSTGEYAPRLARASHRSAVKAESRVTAGNARGDIDGSQPREGCRPDCPACSGHADWQDAHWTSAKAAPTA